VIGPVLSSSSHYRDRADRILRAAEAARNRVELLSAESTFGPVGEALVWLVAVDDLLATADRGYRSRRDADPDGAALPGIRYARNAVVHGEMVVTTTYVKPGAVLGAAALGTFALGEGPSIRWINRVSIAHTPRASRHLAAQEQSYDSHLAGREIREPLNSAVEFLRDAVG
jgi:hypothetical protein